jgi:hypothetical protein
MVEEMVEETAEIAVDYSRWQRSPGPSLHPSERVNGKWQIDHRINGRINGR